MKGLKLLKSFTKAKTFLTVPSTWFCSINEFPRRESFAMKECTCLFSIGKQLADLQLFSFSVHAMFHVNVDYE